MLGYPEQTQDIIKKILEAGIILSFIITYSSIGRFSATKWKEYPYFVAKAYLALIDQATNNAVRLRGFVDGLDQYNLFLERNFKIKINNLRGFCSFMASDEPASRQDIMKKIYECFYQKPEMNDELAPLRELRILMETVYKKDLLVGSYTTRKIQDWLPVAGLVVPLLIALLPLLAK